jgi:hypothetical protein
MHKLKLSAAAALQYTQNWSKLYGNIFGFIVGILESTDQQLDILWKFDWTVEYDCVKLSVLREFLAEIGNKNLTARSV